MTEIHEQKETPITVQTTLEEAIFKFGKMLELNPDVIKEAATLIASAELTPEMYQKEIGIEEIQSASDSINKAFESSIPSRINLLKINPLEKIALNYEFLRIGLIAHYVKEDPQDKPPFSKGEDISGWNLTDTEIEGFKQALEPSILETAEKIIKNPAEFESLSANIPPENIIAAMAYLKVRPLVP